MSRAASGPMPGSRQRQARSSSLKGIRRICYGKKAAWPPADRATGAIRDLH